MQGLHKKIQISNKKSQIDQFYSIKHNSQSNNWIGLNFYEESLDLMSYIGLYFHDNQNLE
jgi:hypothetical protein